MLVHCLSAADCLSQSHVIVQTLCCVVIVTVFCSSPYSAKRHVLSTFQLHTVSSVELQYDKDIVNGY